MQFCQRARATKKLKRPSEHGHLLNEWMSNLQQEHSAVCCHGSDRVLPVALLDCGLDQKLSLANRSTYEHRHGCELFGDDLQVLKRTGVARGKRLEAGRLPARL